MDRRALTSLIAGMAGLAFGVGAVVWWLPVLAAASAVCALVAGACSLALAARVQRAESEASAARTLAQLANVPAAVRHDPAVLIDDVTRLPNERYFELAVDERVAAARRHLWPVSVVLLEITVAPDLRHGGVNPAALSAFAELVRSTLRQSDIACRVGPRSFALVLEDTGEEGAVWTAERLQVALAKDVSLVRRIAAGVATYPVHGLDGGEVLRRARGALSRACAAEAGRGLGQVEVAQGDPT